MACAAFRYSARGSNCVGGPSVVTSLSLVLGSGSAWSWESPAIGSRVARGPVSMSKTTHTASSHEASPPRVGVHPPVERAASVSEGAPPPVGLSRGRSWGSASLVDNDVGDNAIIPGSDDPGGPVPHLQGAQGHDQHHGLGAAALAAAPLMGFQSEGARRSASAENVEADYTFNQPNGSGGLDADPRGTHLETDRGLATAAWAATSAVGLQSTGALRRASTGNVEADHGFHRPDGLDESDEADAWGLHLSLIHI